MGIYERIEKIFKEKQLNFANVERDLGLGNGSLKRWNKSMPSVDKVEKLANYLNVSFSWLATGKDSAAELTEAEIKLLEKYSKLSDGERQEVIGYINCLLAHHIEAAGSETA